MNRVYRINFYLFFIFTFVVLLVRTTHQIDLTDEMQYYGQIKGLVESGHLFQTDLFIQQVVYIVLYPAFYLHHMFFGENGLIFFGRLLMSLITLGVYTYVYNKFTELSIPDFISAASASTLTFAIPYHGIFAPSYNTLSQALWIVAATNFLVWKSTLKFSTMLWSILFLLMFLSHQTAGIALIIIVLVRILWEKDFSILVKIVKETFILFLVAILFLLYFGNFNDYWVSLKFSKGFGVAEVFFSNIRQPAILICIYFSFVISGIFIERFGKNTNSYLLSLAIICFAFVIILVGLGKASGAYSIRMVYLLTPLASLMYGLALQNSQQNSQILEHGIKDRIYWQAFFFMVMGTNMAITSGNGIGQSTGSLMVAIPLFSACGFMLLKPNIAVVIQTINPIKMSITLLILMLFIVHWLSYPYRDEKVWYSNLTINSVPAFKYIRMSTLKFDFVSDSQNFLGPLTNRNARTLIASEYPALYFILGVKQASCMLYMHSTGSEISYKILQDCIKSKAPDSVILFVAQNYKITELINNYIKSEKFECISKTLIKTDYQKSNEVIICNLI